MRPNALFAMVIILTLLRPQWLGTPALAQNDPPPPGAQDLASSEDTPQTPEIQRLAQELRNDPVEIVHWVQANVQVEPTFGIFKGGDAALDQRSANPADQSALTIALLRSARIPARFVVGQIEVSRELATKWLGYAAALDALQYAQQGSFHSDESIYPNLSLSQIILRHVWVEFFVPGEGWIAADPSYKQTVKLVNPGVFALSEEFRSRLQRIIASASVDTKGPSATGLDETAVKRALEEYARKFNQERGSEVIPLLQRPALLASTYQSLAELRQSFPHRPLSIEFRGSSLPGEMRLRIRIRWGDIDVSVSGPSVTNKRISLMSLPERDVDAAAIQRVPGVVPLDTMLRPVIVVDGILAGVSQKAYRIGTNAEPVVSADFTFEYPSGTSDRLGQVSVASPLGGFSSVSFFWGSFSPASFRRVTGLFKKITDDRSSEPISLEELWGGWFHLQGLTHWLLENYGMQIAERVVGATYLRIPSVALTGFGVARRVVSESSVRVSRDNLFVALRHNRKIVISDRQDGSAQKLRWVEGLLSTEAEGKAQDLLYNSAGLSAVEVILATNARRAPIYYAQAGNATEVLDKIATPPALRTYILSAIRQGLSAVIASQPVRSGQISIWGGFLFNSTTGSHGSYIWWVLPADGSNQGTPAWFAPFVNGSISAANHILRRGTPASNIPVREFVSIQRSHAFVGRVSQFLRAALVYSQTAADISIIWQSNLAPDQRWAGVATSIAIAASTMASYTAVGAAATLVIAGTVGAPAIIAVVVGSAAVGYTIGQFYENARDANLVVRFGTQR